VKEAAHNVGEKAIIVVEAAISISVRERYELSGPGNLEILPVCRW
jgi:hypothetical protein